jgi:hypothetical protein
VQYAIPINIVMPVAYHRLNFNPPPLITHFRLGDE